MQEFDLKLYQAALRKLMAEVADALKTNDISYFGMYGTSLGALRHHGFIPWDDDIDIGMLREEYEKALPILRQLHDNFYVWDWDHDENCDIQIARIYRRIVPGMSDLDKNVFIDVFPVDNAPRSYLLRKILRVLIVVLRRLVIRKTKTHIPYVQGTFRSALLYLMGIPFSICSARTLRHLFRFLVVQKKSTGLVWVPADVPKRVYGASDFNSTKTLPFDDIKMPVPIGAENFLTEFYGDWRQLPPIEKQMGHAVRVDGSVKINTPKESLRYVKSVLKILEVSLGLGSGSGGPVRSITGLTRSLSRIEGCETYYFVHNPAGLERFDLDRARVFRGGWNNVGNDKSGDFEQVLDEVQPDIVHFHGIWHLTLHADQVACKSRRIPYVISPRGSLDAWSMRQKAWKKKLALVLFQMKDMNDAVALHVTAEMEAAHCRAIGYKGKFIVSPNGVNLPEILPAWSKHKDGKHRMLFLSRMHPKEGVLESVDAWPKDNDGWCCELVYSLNGDEEREYEVEVKDRIRARGLEKSFLLTGALDDLEKWFAYRRADCFVLPTHTENFGIAIAEALYAGLPVITTKNAPWKGLIDHNCGWWIDLCWEELARTLKMAMNISDEERNQMGARGNRYVHECYSWPIIAEKFLSDCKILLEGRM